MRHFFHAIVITTMLLQGVTPVFAQAESFPVETRPKHETTPKSLQPELPSPLEGATSIKDEPTTPEQTQPASADLPYTLEIKTSVEAVTPGDKVTLIWTMTGLLDNADLSDLEPEFPKLVTRTSPFSDRPAAQISLGGGFYDRSNILHALS
ncbi:MAG: hypothetical protein C0391_09275 [Anaerolinea sp.]|nr:hypothetical protein [Anaerolinea sp.]